MTAQLSLRQLLALCLQTNGSTRRRESLRASASKMLGTFVGKLGCLFLMSQITPRSCLDAQATRKHACRFFDAFIRILRFRD